MHDLKEVRKNSDFYKKKLDDRNSKIDIKKILDLDIAILSNGISSSLILFKLADIVREVPK